MLKSASVVPGVYEAPKSLLSVTESCAASVLQDVMRSANGARIETATMPVRCDASPRTRLLRETVRPWWRCEAARADAAAASRSA